MSCPHSTHGLPTQMQPNSHEQRTRDGCTHSVMLTRAHYNTVSCSPVHVACLPLRRKNRWQFLRMQLAREINPRHRHHQTQSSAAPPGATDSGTTMRNRQRHRQAQPTAAPLSATDSTQTHALACHKKSKLIQFCHKNLYLHSELTCSRSQHRLQYQQK